MDNGITETAKDNNPKNTRLRVNLNFQNPLIGLRSTRFSLTDKMAECNNNLNGRDHPETKNGNVSLKKVQFNVDLEQNYSNLKASLSERNAEVKKQQIVGPTGTVRGFKNIIKERQMNFDKLSESEVETEEQEDGIVFYSTTMGGIRSTVGDCRVIRNIFENHRLKVDERDIFMEKKYQIELDRRLKIEGAQVPQVFVNGVWLGGKKEIMELNETGRLMKLLSEFEVSTNDNYVIFSKAAPKIRRNI
ncbi:glutaredoxin domain-containing cysteine-rich protein 1 [Exaiptasia diaphana]|uniref:Glutaredoxin domain-containing protein n=1 Tax=Exaiptasia diaphana TaxID=2652724 RepID=A0A913YCL6_EXADI|nr:glutaredoxin domain-containing cysteine-rich protein 1 [Exaiptasia diaphana]